jgi:hypothetical protein
LDLGRWWEWELWMVRQVGSDTLLGGCLFCLRDEALFIIHAGEVSTHIVDGLLEVGQD